MEGQPTQTGDGSGGRVCRCRPDRAAVVPAGLLRLGFLADFISAPILIGFKAGTGLLIAGGQLGKVLGCRKGGDNFFSKVGSALGNIAAISWATAALAAASIAILLALRRWGPRSFPGPLLVVALGMLVAAGTELADRGVDLVDSIPPGLPEFVVPDLTMVRGLLPAAAGVALMLSSSRWRRRERSRPRASRTSTPIASFALSESPTSPAAASRLSGRRGTLANGSQP